MAFAFADLEARLMFTPAVSDTSQLDQLRLVAIDVTGGRLRTAPEGTFRTYAARLERPRRSGTARSAAVCPVCQLRPAICRLAWVGPSSLRGRGKRCLRSPALQLDLADGSRT